MSAGSEIKQAPLSFSGVPLPPPRSGYPRGADRSYGSDPPVCEHLWVLSELTQFLLELRHCSSSHDLEDCSAFMPFSFLVHQRSSWCPSHGPETVPSPRLWAALHLSLFPGLSSVALRHGGRCWCAFLLCGPQPGVLESGADLACLCAAGRAAASHTSVFVKVQAPLSADPGPWGRVVHPSTLATSLITLVDSAAPVSNAYGVAAVWEALIQGRQLLLPGL